MSPELIPAPGALWLPLNWLVQPRCPLCRHAPARCTCATAAELPTGGLQGRRPLAWWAAGAYQGRLRGVILELKREPRQRALEWLVDRALPALPPLASAPLLVPIPSWKRRHRANQLPSRLACVAAKRLRGRSLDLLERSRPVLGQHHLARPLRLTNQQGAFHCGQPARRHQRHQPLLLVDDILTSGATALAASEALELAGWSVRGLLCLARTPERQRR